MNAFRTYARKPIKNGHVGGDVLVGTNRIILYFRKPKMQLLINCFLLYRFFLIVVTDSSLVLLNNLTVYVMENVTGKLLWRPWSLLWLGWKRQKKKNRRCFKCFRSTHYPFLKLPYQLMKIYALFSLYWFVCWIIIKSFIYFRFSYNIQFHHLCSVCCMFVNFGVTFQRIIL